MTQTQLLLGSLSNDLFRVANSTQRGSMKAALRFLQEAKRWSGALQQENVADYVIKIAKNVSDQNSLDISMADAERFLMSGILLQNYVLHDSEKK